MGNDIAHMGVRLHDVEYEDGTHHLSGRLHTYSQKAKCIQKLSTSNNIAKQIRDI